MNRVGVGLTVLALALGSVPAGAQPKANDVQPDRLPLGTVYTGALVEGSFLVFEPGKNPDIPFSVTAPAFVKVRRTSTHHQAYGLGKDFIAGTVEFALDTSAAGELSGAFSVTLGKAVATLPISATVRPAEKGRPRLLIVETPFERHATGDGERFSAWTNLVTDASLDVNYLLVTRGMPVLRDVDLGEFDCVLLAARGLTALQPVDIKRVREFAEAGGRVVVAADAFFIDTLERANAVLDGYGIRMRHEETQGGHTVTVEHQDIDPSLVKVGVRMVRFFRASPVAVTNDQSGRLLVKARAFGRPSDGFVASAVAGAGEVVALGQSLWWNWITEPQAAGAENARLLRLLLVP